MREGAKQWVFYEGPPTANGPPGSHHVLSRVFKDIYPRFQTMRGYRVERKGGWDCHGLPVEIAVEQELGIHNKAEIEEYGIAAFNAKCRESVFTFLEEWNRLTERIGFWLDLEHAYRTLDETYIESVWWALAQIDARGLLYEGRKVVPYCPRCETTLSSHEVALGYRDVVDASVFLKLRVLGGEERLLVWTTTPWTLPGNVAVAVSPTATYVEARVGGEVLRARRGPRRAGARRRRRDPRALLRRELVERFGSYEGPIFAAADREPGPLPIVVDEFVTTEDGTGIVHLAPAFGEDDYRVAAASPRVPFDPTRPDTLYNPVRPDGTYDDSVRSRDGGSFEGRFVKDAALTAELIDDLRARGLLLRVQDYEHSYPHCWRCDTPLLYYAKPSWYIATSRLREELLAANETVNWYPPHVKHGRFGDWLKNNVDWALSRERYWGTPLPAWRCPHGHVHVVGSFAELSERSGAELADHHRPYVDDVSFPCPHVAGDRDDAHQCGEPMRRVPEVIDVWFDSGAMPFAQHHFPFEHQAVFERALPGGLHLRGPGSDARLVLLAACGLHAARPCGRSVPQRRLPRSDPRRGRTEDVQVQGQHRRAVAGARHLRRGRLSLVLLHVQAAMGRLPLLGGDDRRGRAPVPQAAVVHVLLLRALRTRQRRPLRGAGGRGPARPPSPTRPRPLGAVAHGGDRRAGDRAPGRLRRDDRRAGRSRSSSTSSPTGTCAARAGASGTASRRPSQTLRTCLVTVAKLLAPFCPFIADEIYDNLDGELESVHLCDFPTRQRSRRATRSSSRRWRWRARRCASASARAGRRRSRCASRSARRSSSPTGASAARSSASPTSCARSSTCAACASSPRPTSWAATRSRPTTARSGPLFGKDMPLVADAIAALDPAHVAGGAFATAADRDRCRRA